MAESKIESKCKKYFRDRGWLVLKFGVDGWPDDYFWNPIQQRTIWIEFKDYSKDVDKLKLQGYRLEKLRNAWKVEAYACNSFESMISQIKNI